ncbi:MAG: hypothetical protein VYA07_03440 [Candidatus Thermoplasmatota archaeon]|nr:hypothetical protein [Candidatus Thermoplasmatota archaeon]
MNAVRILTLGALLISMSFFLSEATADDPDYEFRFDVPSDGSGSMDSNSTMDLKVEIENFITDPRHFKLDITNNNELMNSGLKAWWSHTGQDSLSSESTQLGDINVGNLSTVNGITVTVEASEEALSGTYDVDLKCEDKDDSDPETQQIIQLSVTVNQKTEVLLAFCNENCIEKYGRAESGSGIYPDEDSLGPRGTVDINGENTYLIEISNKGNSEDTLSLSLTGNEWETSLSEDSVTLEAFSSQIITLTVTTDDSVNYEDLDEVTVTATSGNNNAFDDTLNIATQVRVYGGLGLNVISQVSDGVEDCTCPGDEVTITFNILNQWSEGVNFKIDKKDWYRGTLGNTPQGWNFVSGKGSLDPFQDTSTSSSNGVKVTISSSASAGEVVTIILKATSLDEEIWIEREVEIRVEGSYDVRLIVTAPDLEDIECTGYCLPVGVQKSLSSYVKVVNHAKVNDLVTISADFTTGGEDWIITIPQPIAIEASGEKPLYISVQAPEDAIGTEATLKITVESGGDTTASDEATMTFTVTTVSAVSGPETDQLSEESDFPIDPIYLVSIVLIIGLGSAAVFGLQQKSKGAFGSSSQDTDDFSDEWAGMEDSGAAVPQMEPAQPATPPPVAPPQPQAPPQPGAVPPQPQAPPSTAAVPEQPPTPPPAAAPAAPMILTVTVPDGVTAGQQIQIKAPSGQLVNVKVPEGCGPGSQFKIQI